jgi:hypothetical protein
MIFTRDASAGASRDGGASTSCSTPSTRKRTTTACSYGSTWTSLARARTASARSAFTSRMTGASSSVSRRSGRRASASRSSSASSIRRSISSRSAAAAAGSSGAASS